MLEFQNQTVKCIGKSGLLFFLAAFFMVFLTSVNAYAQRHCGAEGQRPCRIWERIPSCNKGLKEDFSRDMCTGPRTQLDARTGK